jgi:hypothetical protein
VVDLAGSEFTKSRLKALLMDMHLDYISQPPLQLGVASWLSPGQWTASWRDMYHPCPF